MPYIVRKCQTHLIVTLSIIQKPSMVYFIYTSLYTTHITFHSMVVDVNFSYVTYICYVEGCKFSTSTHEKYRIVQNITSAICGYFYGYRGPKIALEIAYIHQNSLKSFKPRPAPPLLSRLRDIHLIQKVCRKVFKKLHVTSSNMLRYWNSMFEQFILGH